jgi:peptidoglycan/LPS O-acetylase OafA/YrhL
MTKTTPTLLKTKHHFEILDGLRGVAALAIVLFHFMEIVYPPVQNFIAHGFLAVDFFFCLSGFVIAYAYDDRIGKMGVVEFFKSRLIRLHPMVIFGSVLGLLAFLFDPFGGNVQLYSLGQIILIFLASVFLIPYPTMLERSFNLFGLNAPAWSLFWEYVANIVYAFILFKLSRRLLSLLLILAAAALFFVSYRSGSLLGGWAGENFWDGGARISYSFIAGMLVYRSNRIIRSRLGFPALAVLLMMAFLMPFNPAWTWITEPLVVIFYFPFLVALGAGATLTRRLKKVCIFSGKISYPLYMTHYSVMWIFGKYYSQYKPATTQLFFIVTAAIILLVGFAYLVMRFYDIPVRRYLSAKRGRGI